VSTNTHAASESSMKDRLVSFVGWVIALGMVGLAVYLWQVRGTAFAQGAATSEPNRELTVEVSPVPTTPPDISLPPYKNQENTEFVSRSPSLYTIIPTRPRTDILQYTVDIGDSVFGISNFFGIEPETVLWANYDLLNDNPDYLAPGMELYIPPLDGVYYQWHAGDTLTTVAEEFKAKLDDILSFLGNNIDLANPVIEEGQMIMIPQGRREFRQWLIPTIARGSAGVNTTALGPGACTGSYDGAYGSGAFIWPTGRHFVSGNEYWSGHLGLDLAAVAGDNVYSSDAGVVVFSGWANGGYGYTVMIDHGNGYQSLYAHLSSTAVGCGASVGAGATIGYAGSTGNSTGAHLHFEVRLNGGFINPWFVLPAP
jgi:murein DD-endopeptidase MepM/ murein hydrolase activator NlpD